MEDFEEPEDYDDYEEYDEVEEAAVPASGWYLIRSGKSPTEIILDPEDSRASVVLIAGLTLLAYGLGLFFFPHPSLPESSAMVPGFLGLFLLVVRGFLSDTLVWDLRNKRAYRILNFAGSRWAKRTYEGDEVFVVVVENTNGGLNALSLVTRFGHRYRVVSPRFARNVIKKDAERLARYFDVPVKEGTRGVIPCARAGKSAVLKWKKRPKTTLRAAFLVLLLALPLIVHIAGPLVEKLKGAAP